MAGTSVRVLVQISQLRMRRSGGFGGYGELTMFVEMWSSAGLLSSGDMIIRTPGHMPVRWSDFTSPDVWVRTEAPPVGADVGDMGIGGPFVRGLVAI